MTEQMKTNRGVLLVALGAPYYGNLACNLAASIKATSPEIPVALVWSDDSLNHLNEQKRGVFDTLIECPREMYHRKNGKRVFVKAKTHIFDLSPFDETIFIDADVIMCPRITLTQMFEQLKNLDFTMENRSRVDLANIRKTDVYLWAEINDIVREYGFKSGFLYGLHSEFIYFKKTERVAKYFDDVKKVFNDPRVKMKHVFDGDIPDEFAFAIAMIQNNIYPHETPFVPLYWFLTDKNKGSSLEFVLSNYCGYSVGGNATPESVRRNYDRLARSYFGKLNLQHPFPLIQKRRILSSRKSM